MTTITLNLMVSNEATGGDVIDVGVDVKLSGDFDELEQDVRKATGDARDAFVESLKKSCSKRVRDYTMFS